MIATNDIHRRWARAHTIERQMSEPESWIMGAEATFKSVAQYFTYLDIDLNLKGKSVIEIGGGNFPALSYCENLGQCYLIDPNENSHVLRSIDGRRIQMINKVAEDVEFPMVDEVWIFNTLSHVIGPDTIIDKAKRCSKIIRFFEPIGQQEDEFHLHSFTLDFFKDRFGECVKHYPPNTTMRGFHQHESAYGVYESDMPFASTRKNSKWDVPKHTPGEKFNFDKIPKYVISLRRSNNRRVKVREEFKKHGIQGKFFDAVDKRDVHLPELSRKTTGIFACMSSHIELIRNARDRGLRSICIFEDDVCFAEDFKERIKYIESLPNFSFDIFALGGHFSSKHNPVGSSNTEWKHIRRVTQMGGTYAYILTEKVYDFILRNITYNFGMDEFYSEVVYRRFQTYAFVPFLCGCVPCKSEITGEYWEYENVAWTFNKEKIHL